MSEKNWIEMPAHAQSFVKRGFIVVPIKRKENLEALRRMLVSGLRANMTGGENFSNDESYLNNFHQFVDHSRLNDVRVKVHREVGGSEEFKRLLFECVKEYLFDLIGTEIVMQRQVNFVAHMPNDPTALLYLHTDSWAGCSPYEVILWLPLVNVFGTKSMYICDLEHNTAHLSDLKKGLKLESAAELLKKIRPDIAPLKMEFGDALLFSPTLLHGAEENKTDETRFILNVRFKSLFSPYGTKALGETFVPVNYLPATEIGLKYEAEFGIVRG